MATVPTQCLQKVLSRSDRCPCNKFHFREKIYRENTLCHEAPTGRPHKSHGTGFPHVSRAWKEKTLLACWKLLSPYREAVSFSAARFLSLVGESSRLFMLQGIGNKQICHIMTQTCALLESNLGQFCKKACFIGRAQCVP